MSKISEKNNNTITSVKGLTSYVDSNDEVENDTHFEIDPNKEQMLIHKFDIRLMPMFGLVYFVSYQLF